MWGEITYLLINFTCFTVELCEWLSNFSPDFTWHVISNLRWDLSCTMLVKGASCWQALASRGGVISTRRTPSHHHHHPTPPATPNTPIPIAWHVILIRAKWDRIVADKRTYSSSMSFRISSRWSKLLMAASCPPISSAHARWAISQMATTVSPLTM